VPLLSTSPVIADKHFTPTPSPQTIYSVGDSLKLSNGSRIGFIGGGLGSRMNIFNEFETELQRRYPQHKLYIRNFCKEGDTPKNFKKVLVKVTLPLQINGSKITRLTL